MGMASKKSSASQEKKTRANLRKLRELGLISKKTDLRKKPGRAQKAALKKFDDVLTGKAKVVKPKDPKSFKGLFKVVGDNVIVPRRKGERITTNRQGEIVSKRKVGNRLVTSRFEKVPKTKPIRKSREGMQYAIPFAAKGGGIRWMRFPKFELLQQFMAGYDYKGWRNYVVEESISEPLSARELDRVLSSRGIGIQDKKRAARKTTRARGRARRDRGDFDVG